ncbi:MAG TPA: helicase-related protein, partial [Nitrososphaeraceae archaeon]|nr:helicase-related protein [Nitrososphaeraceae archaeon]
MTFKDQDVFTNHPLLRKNVLQFREYQKNISSHALRKNTLVILPTALGKTIISLLVAVNTLYNYRSKRILILAPTRPLVNQHWKSFVSYLKLQDEQMAVVTGKIPPYARSIVWNRNEIRLVFSTPEVVRNDIREKRLELDNFYLVVFDEAHRAVKDYAYTFIADQYVKHCSFPLILGLTASPGSEKNKIQEICNNLFTEHLEYKTEEDPDVIRYINPIDIDWEWFDLPSEYQYVKSILKSMLDEKLDWLISRKIITKNSKWIFKRDLISIGDELRRTLITIPEERRRSLYFALMQQSNALSLMYCIELMESQGFYSLRTFLNRIQEEGGKSHKMLIDDNRIIEIRRLVEQLHKEHPKIQHLIKILDERFNSQISSKNARNLSQRESEMDSRVLIFTQYRDTAQHIVELLTKNKVRASKFVGQSKRQGDPGMKQEEQNTILEKFREGEFNVLVATSIAEEGLDIPEVDLVVFYEPIPSEIRHIQRRGRTGRKNLGSVLILATKDTIDQRYLDVSRKKIQKMKSILSSIDTQLKFKSVHRISAQKDPMTKEEIEFLDSCLDKYGERIKQGLAKAGIAKISLRKSSYSTPKSGIKGIRNSVESTARKLYSIVSMHGNSGLDIQLLHKSLRQDDVLVNAALKMLEKLDKIKITGDKVIASDNLVKIQGRVFNIEIERVAMGKALVLVNSKWRAILNHYDYRGPRELIKKGREFKASGELYRDNNSLNIRVEQI